MRRAVTFASLAIAALSLPAAMLLAEIKLFHATSVSMAPTLLPGDKFLANTTNASVVGRGDVILFKPNGRAAAWVMRVAGLPGDRIELIEGIVLINGKRVEQTILSTEEYKDEFDSGTRTILSERFPGEPKPHRIYDTRASATDNHPATLVPKDHIFVLGDNRDNASDSRISKSFGGVEMVPKASIIAHPTKIYWSRDKSRMDTAVI